MLGRSGDDSIGGRRALAPSLGNVGGVTMAKKLDGKRIAVLATDGVEASELSEPVRAARDAGAQVELVSLRSGQIQPESGDMKMTPVPVDRVVADVAPEAYDGLILPGGTKNPDRLRTNPDAVEFVRGFWDAGKPIASICHGPWMLVEADVVHDLTLTSWPSLRTDVENAGGHWVDEQVHVDHGVVTSRKPDDLPAFCAKLVEEFAEGRHDRAGARTAAASRSA
jgi:protease I